MWRGKADAGSGPADRPARGVEGLRDHRIELDELARGSPTSLHLNFALFFWGVSISLLATLLATTIPSTRVFIVFVVFFVGTFIPAVVFSVLWWLRHRSTGDLVRRIRDRMPPAPGIQEPPAPPPDPKQLPGA